jgi:hypothetical protein
VSRRYVQFRHLTWEGRVTWCWYRLRGVLLQPAPEGERCIMGGPIGEDIRCPRPVVNGGWWCSRCARRIARAER